MPLNWLRKTCYSVIETRARVSPEAVALIVTTEDGSARSVSYRELHDGVLVMAGHLSGAGVELGTHLGIWADNSLAWVEAWLASSYVGSVTVAFNTRLTPREVGDLIAANDVTHLLVGGGVVAKATSMADTGGAPGSCYALDSNEAFPSLQALSATPQPAVIDGQRVGLIQFTSGSTGLPKGAQLREGAIAAMGASCASRWMLSPADRILGVFSLGHNAGTTYTTMAAFTAGAAMIFPAGGWGGGAGIAAAEACGATVVPGVDTIIADLLASPTKLSALRLVVGGFDRATAARIADRLGVEVSNTYGLTEVTANSTVGDLRDPLDRRIERIGLPHPGLEARVVDDEGTEVAATVPGELQLRGWNVMQGYYGLPAEDQPFTPDGWVRTGDLGSIDADGYLSFLGRLKDVIRSGGENVASFEIERYLESHPHVLQAAVVPAPHPRFGEVPCAFVRLLPDVSLSAAELLAYCEWQLAIFKIPKYFEFVESFPLVGINKVSKPELRRRAEELAADANASR